MPPDYFCVDGACIPDDECYYGSGGYGYCCYDYCCDYDCYSDCYYVEDCGPGEYCSTNYGECYGAEEMGNCEPPATHFIPLPVDASGGAVALAFGNAEPGGGEELLVVSSNEARLVGAGGTTVTPSVQLPGANADASAAAVATGSGTGFAVSVPEAGGVQLVTLAGGSLEAGPPEVTAPLRIVSGDFDGDGIDDVAGLDAGSLVWLQGSGSGFPFGQLIVDSASAPLAAGRIGTDGLVNIAGHEEYGSPYYLQDIADGGDMQFLYGRAAAIMSIAAIDYDADGDDDIVGLTSSQGTMLVLPWQNVGGGDHYVEWTRWTTTFARTPDVATAWG